MAKTKSTEPAKSKAQAIREAIEQLQGEGREVTTAAILALLPGLGIKDAKAMDIYYSTPWKELRAKEKTAEPDPVAGVVVVVESAPAEGGITKTEAVKEALEKLGGDAKPKAVVEHVKQEHGLDISSQLVSNYKATKRKKAGKRGRPRKVSVEGTVTAKPVKISLSGDISLDDIRLVKDLADRIGAEKIRQLAEVLA